MVDLERKGCTSQTAWGEGIKYGGHHLQERYQLEAFRTQERGGFIRYLSGTLRRSRRENTLKLVSIWLVRHSDHVPHVCSPSSSHT